jgi:hypothetical protein
LLFKTGERGSGGTENGGTVNGGTVNGGAPSTGDGVTDLYSPDFSSPGRITRLMPCFMTGTLKFRRSPTGQPVSFK